MMGGRKIPITGSLYAYLLHRVSDLIYENGWDSLVGEVYIEIGKAVRGAKLRDNNQLAGGGQVYGSKRKNSEGSTRGVCSWGEVRTALEGSVGEEEEDGGGRKKAVDINTGRLLVRVGMEEGEKVGTAERRIARVSGAGRGRRAEV